MENDILPSSFNFHDNKLYSVELGKRKSRTYDLKGDGSEIFLAGRSQLGLAGLSSGRSQQGSTEEISVNELNALEFIASESQSQNDQVDCKGVILADKSENEEGNHEKDHIASKLSEASEEKCSKGSVSHGDGLDHAGKLNHHSQSSDEKRKLPHSRITSRAPEKLWEGSLKLNSSITVSAVAFFKSGERLQDVNWSDFIEVKGKVRLEAFEQFIQELPRSRNRGMMVVSLCWKEGSSKSGFQGMKEVAKGYLKEKRVARAPLGPGLDLYVCPRSNAIITILAKHGFFKGMAAIEENSELLIGCVIWRKNHLSSLSVAKESEISGKTSSENHILSNPDSSTKQFQTKSSSSPPVQTSTSVAGVKSPPSLENSSNVRSKKVESENSPGSNSLSFSSFCANSSLQIGAQQSGHSYSQFQSGDSEQSGKGASYAIFSEVEGVKKGDSEFLKSAPIVLCNVTKQTTESTNDDDDLPEFDFGTACGISSAVIGKQLDVSCLGNRLETEGSRTADSSTLSTRKSGYSVSLCHNGSASLGVPMVASTFDIKSHIPHVQTQSDPQVCISRKVEEGLAIPSDAVAGPPPKESPKILQKDLLSKLFRDDDDDMPEWIPPDMEMHLATKTLHTFASETFKSTASIQPKFHSGQQQLSALGAARPELSTQAYPLAHGPPTRSRVLPPTHYRNDSSASSGFTYKPAIRAPSSLVGGQPPAQPVNNRKGLETLKLEKHPLHRQTGN